MKPKILVIPGGMTYKNDTEFNKQKNNKAKLYQPIWLDFLKLPLPEFDISYFNMPNRENAKYSEWKSYFEKYLPHINQNTHIIAKSLGGIFLIKYLSENRTNISFKNIHLIAPPFDAEDTPHSLRDFNLKKKNINSVDINNNKVVFYFSSDDPVVLISHYEKYKNYLPNTQFKLFEDRGHFNQNNFPELIRHIKKP